MLPFQYIYKGIHILYIRKTEQRKTETANFRFFAANGNPKFVFLVGKR